MTTAIATAAYAPASLAPLCIVYAELPRLELKGITWDVFQRQQEQLQPQRPEQQHQMLKEYVWKHCQDQLLQALRIDIAHATPTNCIPKLSQVESSVNPNMPSIHDAVLASTVINNVNHVAGVKAKAMPTTRSHLFQGLCPPEGDNTKIKTQLHQPCCSCLEKVHQVELANAKLLHSHQQAVRRSSAQLKHFACASHEIRTPLNCIIGLTSLLQTTDLNPLQAESLQLISGSSELLLTVVNDVLDYSKLESGHVDVSLKPANLQEILLGVVQSMELKHHNSSIQVRTQYSPLLPPTWTTDRLRLQQILFNLLGNAFKFSPPNGCIDLKVEIGPPGQPSVPSHAPKSIAASNVLRFVVKDYGCGIAPAALQRIFQPFVQAGEDTAKAYEGTGLGLAITSKLTKNLGGCVYAHSTVGVGSEFVVEFPFNQEQFFNVQALGERLANITCLIVPGPNLPQAHALQQMLDTYQVSYRILESMDDLDRISLQEHQSSSKSFDVTGSSGSTTTTTMDESTQSVHDAIVLPPDQTYVCWIDESVYQRDAMQRFQLEVEHADTTSLLWTVGPAYSVAEASHHFRNLLQMVPSVLMQTLAEEVEELVSSRGQASFNTKQDMADSIAPKQTRRQRDSQRVGKKIKKTCPPSSQIPPTETRDKRDISILIVEDNVINQKVLRALLKKLGYNNVAVVNDGQKAVDAVAHDTYDVVLMDVQMPVMNGLEATRVIVGRQQESEQLPKIVFVTATVDQTLEEEAKELGAVGFVPKPFNLRQLEVCMTDLCRSIPEMNPVDGWSRRKK